VIGSVSLHWLRVPERIQFKIAVLTYRVSMVTHHCTWGRSPADVPGWRALRSAGTKRLAVFSVRLSTVGSRAFRLPPLKSGTLYWNTSSQPPRYSPSGVTWKRFYYNNLSVYSTLVDLVVISVTYATLKNQWLIDSQPAPTSFLGGVVIPGNVRALRTVVALVG